MDLALYDGTESGRYMRKMEGTLASEQRTMNKFALLLLVLLIVHSEAGDMVRMFNFLWAWWPDQPDTCYSGPSLAGRFSVQCQ